MKTFYGFHRDEPQRRPLSRPLPRWRRMTRWDWLLVALCLIASAVCIALEMGG